MTDRFTDRLSQYLDDELEPDERAQVAEHLARCDACRRTLDELREVVALAASRPTIQPGADLWPGIRERLHAAGPAEVVPIEAAARRPLRRRFTFSVPQLAAAAVALMLVSGGAVWLALGARAVAPDAVASLQVAQDSPGLGRLVSDDASYQATLAELERALASSRDRLDPVTIAVLESNLRLIDAAIAEATEALARDPGNAYLSEHLGQTREKKIDVLRRAADIGRAEI
jgi:anti-sigma factor RsiW